MSFPIRCGECSEVSDIPDSDAGGSGNCPRCGSAIAFPEAVAFACDECGASMIVDKRLAGKLGKCLACNAKVRIPQGHASVPHSPKTVSPPCETRTSSLSNPTTSVHPTPPQRAPSNLLFLLTVVGGGFLLTSALVALVLSRSHRAAMMEAQQLSDLTNEVETAIKQSDDCGAQFEFSEATQHLERAQEKVHASLMPAYELRSLAALVEQAENSLDEAKNTYQEKLAEGYVAFEGRFVTPEERADLLDARERKKERKKEQQLAKSKRGRSRNRASSGQRGVVDYSLVQTFKDAWQSEGWPNKARSEQAKVMALMISVVRTDIEDPAVREATLNYIQRNIGSW